MSMSMKALILTFSFIALQATFSVNVAMGSELTTLTAQEFQLKKNAPDADLENLSEYEINNEDVVMIHKIESQKDDIRLLASK